jgi:hypothetical protein
MIKAVGGEAQYMDHMVSSEIMEKYNYKTYEFFAAWHYDASKQDIFNYRGIDVGSAFRIEIWDDITFYVRMFLNLHEFLKKIKYETIYSGIDNPVVMDILGFLGISAVKWPNHKDKNTVEYYFPISGWIHEALYPTRMRYKIKVSFLRVFDVVLSFVDRLRKPSKAVEYVYIERYYPTNDIISELKKVSHIKMVRSDFNSMRDILSGIHLPIFVSESNQHMTMVKDMFRKFDKEKYAKLYIENVDISNELYKIIIKRVSVLIAKSLKMLDVIFYFFSKRYLSLMITIGSIGIVNRLMINYCKKNDIPIYTIINGLLANSFLDEAKEGTWINSYGDSVKEHYFKGMDNIVCFGDPRMDTYATSIGKKKLDCRKPTLGIGASGFTSVDLNCFLAIEFEFLNDILKACEMLRERGREMDLVIKVRSNGYIQQYKDFLNEYYPDIQVRIFDFIPMWKIYEQSDFFISIYSQALFEAACLGIPVLYYKNDTQYFHPPFDGKSELVTAFDQEDLAEKIDAFYDQDSIYEPFKEKKVLEKYVGPLDGKNLKRNMDFIYSLISKNNLNK